MSGTAAGRCAGSRRDDGGLQWSGISVCRLQADIRTWLKLIIIDGVNREMAEARQKGIIDGYVEKPVSDTAILEAIRNCASQPV